MEFQCQPKPQKPFYYCPAYWTVLRQIAKARLHIGRALFGTPRGPMTMKELDRLCWGHVEALPYPYSHPIWKGKRPANDAGFPIR